MKTTEGSALEKGSGCLLKRHGKRHDIWVNPQNGHKASIPRHAAKEIATGTVLAVKNELGLK